MIRVESDKRNQRGERIAYDLMPLRHGTPRHNEEFTRHDLWVSRSHPEKPTEFIFANLPNIVKDEEVVEETDIVLWCNSAVHHEPRNEDGKPNSGRRLWPGDDAWEGSALLMWSGFDLRPRNFFTQTPFYPFTPEPPRPLANRQPQPGDPQPNQDGAAAVEPQRNIPGPERRN
jgi:Cu2+-containing amine oxidase